MSGRKIVALLVLLLAVLVGTVRGTWRADVAGLLRQKDYAGAEEVLSSVFSNLDEGEKPVACVLRIFLSAKRSDREAEKAWARDYFEKYRAPNVSFGFLDLVSEGEATASLNRWRQTYPFVSEITFVRSKKETSDAPPQELEIGVEMGNPALYKFSDRSGVRKGGELHRGLNLLTVPTAGYFDESGAVSYTLDLKAGDISLRKILTIEIRLSGESVTEPPPTETRDVEYKLSLYVEEKMVATSRKNVREENPLALNIPKTNLVANPLFKPPDNDDPFDPTNRGASILDALSLAMGLLNDLTKKKPDKPPESSIEKVPSVTFTLSRLDREGRRRNVQALVSLTVETAS